VRESSRPGQVRPLAWAGALSGRNWGYNVHSERSLGYVELGAALPEAGAESVSSDPRGISALASSYTVPAPPPAGSFMSCSKVLATV
jgi:hypothetical protein